MAARDAALLLLLLHGCRKCSQTLMLFNKITRRWRGAPLCAPWRTGRGFVTGGHGGPPLLPYPYLFGKLHKRPSAANPSPLRDSSQGANRLAQVKTFSTVSWDAQPYVHDWHWRRPSSAPPIFPSTLARTPTGAIVLSRFTVSRTAHHLRRNSSL